MAPAPALTSPYVAGCCRLFAAVCGPGVRPLCARSGVVHQVPKYETPANRRRARTGWQPRDRALSTPVSPGMPTEHESHTDHDASGLSILTAGLVVDLIDVSTAAILGAVGLDQIEIRRTAATIWGER